MKKDEIKLVLFCILIGILVGALTAFLYFNYQSKSFVTKQEIQTHKDLDSVLFKTFDYGDDFRTKVTISAIKLYEKTDILPSILICQAILESGHGKHIHGNNVFGIKAGNGWKGETVSFKTKEHLPLDKFKNKKGYKLVKKLDKGMGEFECEQTFRAYESIHESLSDYCEFIAGKPQYSRIKGKTDHKEAVEMLCEGKYATDVNYGKKLNNLYGRYDCALANSISLVLKNNKIGSILLKNLN